MHMLRLYFCNFEGLPLKTDTLCGIIEGSSHLDPHLCLLMFKKGLKISLEVRLLVRYNTGNLSMRISPLMLIGASHDSG